MWIFLALISALCLGFYDISKKRALTLLSVVDVLTYSVCLSSVILMLPLFISRLWPEALPELMYVPRIDATAHAMIMLKSLIVLASWIFAYIALKHLPLSLVSPMQATRPMWTLVGALFLFGERLNLWQWLGVVCALGSIFAFSLYSRHQKGAIRSALTPNQGWYYVCLILGILIGACSGLYDKYMMRRYDHNAVQVYYTIYQALMMLVVYAYTHYRAAHSTSNQTAQPSTCTLLPPTSSLLPVIGISIFLVLSDYVYMLALTDPAAMIAVVSTIRRGGAILSFGYGVLVLREPDPWPKVACVVGVATGLAFLALGSLLL